MKPTKALSVREALFSLKEELSAEKCAGRILADVSVACPPAVPIVVCGEIIDEKAVEAFKYYNIEKCMVVKQ